MATNRELIERGYAAYARKDFSAILALLDPEIEAHQSTAVPWGGDYRGLAEFGRYMAKLTEYVDTVVDAEEIVEAGDHVVMLGWSHGTVRASGRRFRLRAVHVWQMESGKARRLDVYLDTPAQLRALAP